MNPSTKWFLLEEIHSHSQQDFLQYKTVTNSTDAIAHKYTHAFTKNVGMLPHRTYCYRFFFFQILFSFLNMTSQAQRKKKTFSLNDIFIKKEEKQKARMMFCQCLLFFDFL